MADDLGYADVSCYGRREYTTANIDRLAQGGMRFMQAYANSAVCSATRTALITGRYQYRYPIGLEEPLNTRDVGLSPDVPTLPSLLKKAGYATALIGKWHLGSPPKYGPEKSGYDRFYGFDLGSSDYFNHANSLWDGEEKANDEGYLTNLLGDRAVATVEDFARARTPFLISLHFNAPHWPWEGPEDQAIARRVTAPGGSLFHLDGGSLATYAKMVLAMDAAIGRVLTALERAGVAENTIVIFTSDNGGERFSDTWPFSGKKTELLEGGVRIPAIVRWPGRVRAGSTSDQTMMSMDWLPTFLAAAGAASDPASPPDGINLAAAALRRRARLAQALLALQAQSATGDARRRLEVSQDPRQHVPVQRGRRSAGAREPERAAARHLRPPRGRVARLGRENAAARSDVVDRRLRLERARRSHGRARA